MVTDKSPERIRQVAAELGAESLLLPEVLRNTRIVSYEEGETMMTSGDPVEEVSVLFRGAMRVYSVSESGKLVTVAVARPPEMFGDIEFLQGRDTLHSVVAETQSEVLCFALRDVRTYLAENVVFYRMICNNLIEKLYNTSSNYSRVLQYPTKTLLAQYLLRSREADGIVSCKSRELAEYLGVAPRHISRLITELVEEGAVARESGRRLRVTDPERLRACMDQLLQK